MRTAVSLSFTFLFPLRQNDGDGYRAKQQQHESLLTVTAISPVTTVRLLTTLWDTESTHEPPRGVVYSCPYAFKNHKHTSTKCGIFTAVNHLSSLHVFQCNYLATRSLSSEVCNFLQVLATVKQHMQESYLWRRILGF